jgi:uncharacterized phage protein (TIGR01671 family)
MNKIIKFRAWNKIKKEMNYKVLVGNTDLNDTNYTCNAIYQEGKGWVNADDVCIDLMQYIGIKDKNDVEIYSDDLLKDNEGVIFRIYAVAGGFAIKANYWKDNCNDLVHTDALIMEALSYPQNASSLSQCEVIGNYHLNKELIKQL